MYGYIYETTNLINGRKYIGKHKAEKFDHSYLGSGKILKEAFDRYGRENFICKILDPINVNTICETLEELNNAEKYYIDYYDCIESPLYYNIAKGGDGGITSKIPPMLGKHHTKEVREKIKQARLKQVFSPESRIKKSNTLSEKWHNDLDYRQKMICAQKKRWESVEAREQQSLRCKNANYDILKELNKRYIGTRWYNNGIEQHRYIPGSEPVGFVKGFLPLLADKLKIKKSKISAKYLGRHWYNNGIIQVFRFDCPKGFVPGMLKRKKLDK